MPKRPLDQLAETNDSAAVVWPKLPDNVAGINADGTIQYKTREEMEQETITSPFDEGMQPMSEAEKL